MGSTELGIDEGVLDPSRTVRRLKYDGPEDVPFRWTEIFGDEVCSLVTDTALYRETAFTIFVPSDNPMMSRLPVYLDCNDTQRGCDIKNYSDIACPWVYSRLHMTVSFR